jgi:hypothetical protein
MNDAQRVCDLATMAYVETYGKDGTRFALWEGNACVWGLRENYEPATKALNLATMRVHGPECLVKCNVHVPTAHPAHDRCPRVTVAEALLGRVCHLAQQEART